MTRPLILGVGLAKTGTSSLNAALRMLGYTSAHNPLTLLRVNPVNNEMEIDLAGALAMDALTDLPVARFYRELDEAAAHRAKFVVTTREMSSWLKSIGNHLYEAPPQGVQRSLVIDLLGADKFDKEVFEAAYHRYYADLDSYLGGREGDVLRLDLNDQEKFQKLCKFLGKPLPDAEYPNVNVASRVPRVLKDVVRSNKSLLRFARKVRPYRKEV